MKKLLLVQLLASLFISCTSNDEVLRLEVDPGSNDRFYSIITFDLPDSLTDGNLQLVTDSGKKYPVQLQRNKGMAIIDTLKAGQILSLTFSETEKAEASPITSRRNNVSFDILDQNELALSYRHQPELPDASIDSVYLRAGYLHPVVSPSGKVITNDYPDNHRHHHGIWAAWTRTRFQDREPDFWNMAEKTGTVLARSLDSTWTGPVSAGFEASHDYVDLIATPPVTALNEKWKVQYYAVPADAGFRIFDLEVLQNVPGDTLFLPEYRYGGVGFRGNGAWEGPDSCYFLTSEGKTRADGHATSARWCHVGGYIDGTFTGVAVLDHPENFRHPQPMRIHPSEPFFNYAPSQAGDWQIDPAQTYQARYRFIVFDGQPEPDKIDRQWKDYAEPVQTKWVKQ